jgi:hypothetical protein
VPEFCSPNHAFVLRQRDLHLGFLIRVALRAADCVAHAVFGKLLLDLLPAL